MYLTLRVRCVAADPVLSYPNRKDTDVVRNRVCSVSGAAAAVVRRKACHNVTFREAPVGEESKITFMVIRTICGRDKWL